MLYIRRYDGVDHTHLERFPKLDCSTTTKRVPAPNDTSSESSRREVSDADFCSAPGALFQLLSRYINHGISAQGVCDNAPTIVHGSQQLVIS